MPLYAHLPPAPRLAQYAVMTDYSPTRVLHPEIILSHSSRPLLGEVSLAILVHMPITHTPLVLVQLWERP